MQDFKKLRVWEKAHQLTLEVYRVTVVFPRQERFGLVDQLRRSSSSIAANIAEGCGRLGRKELHRFVSIAAGSASETEYHLLLARDLDYLDTSQHQSLQEQVIEVKRMLSSLAQKLTTDNR
ncbi:MAG: four helix bundle protein [Proteobacteria bacterium]|nr:four helix bundle protein [Pseudomonadota bacterium]